jgi:hypothetical protein
MYQRYSEVRRTAQKIVLAAFGVLLLAVLAIGQVTSGTIFGAVKDPSGAYVANATVTVNDTATGVSRTVTTDDSGGFVVPNLPPGTYAITIEVAGFKKLEKTGVILSAADHLNAGEFMLTVGAAAEQITVTAEGAELQLQSNSGERSDLITSKQLDEVAMNGRNVLDYMKLIPGVISGFDGHESGTGGLDTLNINGTRANEHEFTIDGASNVDTGNNGGTHITINPDAIEEVKILTSNYQAEFGKAAGGQIAIVTKGGTNEWHGNGRFFHRNEGMNANDWIANRDGVARPIYRYNYIGYDIGGPIVKNRLFFFWNQEYYRQRLPIGGTTEFYVPTALERQGDFSQSTDGNGKPVVISGPGITNNKIDPTKLSSAQQTVFTQVQKMLNLFPLPNVSGFGVGGQNFNFAQALSGFHPRREDILRVDYQLNGQNRLFGRWIYNADSTQAPFTSSGIGPFGTFACDSSVNFPGGCTQKHPGWNVSLNLVSTITPTVLNEFSIGPSHTLSIADGTNGNISLAKNGINLPLLYPSTTLPDLSFNDLQNVNFGGGYLGATPWKQANTTINVNDNLTWVKGVHAFKFGAFYQRSRKDQIAWGNINGQINFGAGPTAPATCPVPLVNNNCPDQLGDPLASALLGGFSSLSQSTARPTGYFRYNQLEFYVQDTWKVTPRFTLDYGMRFAWIPPQFDAKNRVAIFDPASYNPAKAVTIDGGGNIVPGSGNPLDGMLYAKNGQIPAGGWNSRGIMPEPRFGFAYDLLGNRRTVLRGGVGMMHDRAQGNLIFNTVFNNPALVQTAQLPVGNLSTLASSAASFPLSIQSDKNIIGAARDGKVPTVYSFSLGIQREIGKGTTLDVAYVGSLGRNLITSRDINAIPYGTAFSRAAQDPANFTSYCASPAAGNPCTNGIPAVEPGLPAMYSSAGFNFSGAYAFGRMSYSNAPLVPYKGYGQIAYMQWDGTSNYNSLQASLQRRFSKGFIGGLVYTWSKALTTATADQDYQDPFNPTVLGYRAADWDRTHVFAANYVYDLPNASKHLGGSKLVAYITDNYQLSGVIQYMTGTPVDLNNYWSWEPGAVDGGNMWGAIPFYYALDKSGNPILPPVGTRVAGTRDVLRNYGLQNWDMSLFKNIPLGEGSRRSIQLRFEAYNAFNHPNLISRNYNFAVDVPQQWTYSGQAGGGSNSAAYDISKAADWGRPAGTPGTGGGGFRVLQLGAKFYF